MVGLRRPGRPVWRGTYIPPEIEKALAADQPVSWTIELQSQDETGRRTVTLKLPAPPPRWGSMTWSLPEGRTPAVVPESGPLAERAKLILDNGIWSTMYWRPFHKTLQPDPKSVRRPVGYQWSVPGRPRRGFSVSQERGRTDILLTAPPYSYLTSPTGVLERALRWEPGFAVKPWKEVPLDEARAGFEAEVDFWLNQVGKVSARWPLERIPTAHAVTETGRAEALQSAGTDKKNILPTAFLKLPQPTEEQRAVFDHALRQIGSPGPTWAFTETVRDIESQVETVTRVDPSKPEPSSATLLKVAGRAPKPADVDRWRNSGGTEIARNLDDLVRALRTVATVADVRLFEETRSHLVFEIAAPGGTADLPLDKGQALIRIDKQQRSLESFTIKLRESMPLHKLVKVTQAGLELRFRTVDLDYPPQPVYLRMGGAIRAALLVRISRYGELSRKDFQRVELHSSRLAD